VSRFIAIANQKGGVGKTTTTVNLAASLARFGQRVLVLDMDPQGNTSSGLGVQPNALHRGIYEVLLGTMAVEEAITSQASPGVDLLPSGQRLIGAEVELVSALARERILEKSIQPVRDNYDVLLADCPPSLGLLTVNTLTAADTVLIPMQCEYYALEGLTQLVNTIKLIQQALNPRLEIEGILLTMFDARLNLSHEVAEETRKFFPGRVYETVIPRNVRLSEAPSFGKPVLEYDPECAGAQFYLKLAREVLKLPGDAMPVAPQVEEPEAQAVAEPRFEDAEPIHESHAALSEEPPASPESSLDRASVEATLHDPAASIAMDRDAHEVEAIAAQLSEATPVASESEDMTPAEVPSGDIAVAEEEPEAEVPSTDVVVAEEEHQAADLVVAEIDQAEVLPSAGISVDVLVTSDLPPALPDEEPIVTQEQPLSLSPDDLAEDVLTLPEESIVLATEAEAMALAVETQWGADPNAGEISQPAELVASPASDTQNDTPPNNAAQYNDLQPLTEQDDHHPQEELVSHD